MNIERIPYFGQPQRRSYLSYDTIKDAQNNFDIEISFKPQSTSGLFYCLILRIIFIPF